MEKSPLENVAVRGPTRFKAPTCLETYTVFHCIGSTLGLLRIDGQDSHESVHVEMTNYNDSIRLHF